MHTAQGRARRADMLGMYAARSLRSPRIAAAATIVIALATSTVRAQVPELSALGAPLAPVLTTYGDPDSASYVDVPSSFDGVARLLISRPSGIFGCSGALVGEGGFVLTAAHCVTNASGIVDAASVTATFAAAAGAPARVIAGSAISVAPGWNGDFRDGADLALLRLDAPVGATHYTVARDPQLGIGAVVTIAGYGRSGSGAAGNDAIGFGVLRVGSNRYDTRWSDAAVADSPLAFDFDDGSIARDTIGNNIPALRDLGTGFAEVLIAPGDSGGPSFLDTVIIGVHSFGATFGSPYDIDAALNSSFGELAGDVRVALYADWIDSVTAVPEPRTYMLMLCGLAMLLSCAWYRRQRQPVRAADSSRAVHRDAATR